MASTHFMFVHIVIKPRSKILVYNSGVACLFVQVSIPVKKIECAYESENVKNPGHKYIEIVTKDKFEFWFMGFVRYEKAWTNLQTAISLSR